MGYAGGDAPAQIDRGTSVRNFEMPHLRSSAISSTRASRGTSGDELGGHRLQLKTHGQCSRPTAVGRRAGDSLNCFRMFFLHPELLPYLKTQKHKGDAPELGTSPFVFAITNSFRNSLDCRPFFVCRACSTAWR